MTRMDNPPYCGLPKINKMQIHCRFKHPDSQYIYYFLQKCKKGKPYEMDLPFFKTIQARHFKLILCLRRQQRPSASCGSSGLLSDL
jgi:hypothetical protein